MDCALFLAHTHPNFKRDTGHLKDEWRTIPIADYLTTTTYFQDPWIVRTPKETDSDIYQMLDTFPPSTDVTKFGFSAAALAIKFLTSIKEETRAYIRNIVLEEDHPAVSMSASHGMGLIPFCQHNPLLRIERRVHLWRNIFLQGALPRVCKYIPVYPSIRGLETLDAHLSESMTRSVALWTMEAMSLVSAQMPIDSFSLVFHADRAPEKCSEVFQNVIKRDATWQAAIEENVKLGLLEPLDFFHRPCSTFPFDTFTGFPQALEEAIANKNFPFIRCDFDIGEYSTSEAKKLAEERREWTLEMWRLKWLEVGLVNWNDIPSLLEEIPLFKELLSES
ncbi:uncharacterized protein GGS22DRAFT_162216 [Annulohypoxylon maeteangense]|uniref:uncharacterized protein n=1 Tax=Annulohypoxylon maeteangense TaxID=1927788 RepID=UPI002007C0C4|nr:uncharacterized protein GGS22DRAFT_162216 [Annulohypoxylon maeteangense]KAI0885886.1 hypothetical protein GGS22DRAFT_162216 [Annulohypoxylon maeteangense]